jgi:hypothetical protein
MHWYLKILTGQKIRFNKPNFQASGTVISAHPETQIYMTDTFSIHSNQGEKSRHCRWSIKTTEWNEPISWSEWNSQTPKAIWIQRNKNKEHNLLESREYKQVQVLTETKDRGRFQPPESQFLNWIKLTPFHHLFDWLGVIIPQQNWINSWSFSPKSSYRPGNQNSRLPLYPDIRKSDRTRNRKEPFPVHPHYTPKRLNQFMKFFSSYRPETKFHLKIQQIIEIYTWCFKINAL